MKSKEKKEISKNKSRRFRENNRERHRELARKFYK